MCPLWLVEARVYGVEADPLLAEMPWQGIAVEVVAHPAPLREKNLFLLGPAIGYSTFSFTRKIQLHRRWIPGPRCEPEKLDCGGSVWARRGQGKRLSRPGMWAAELASGWVPC